jgi:LPS export ABC transporter protein LptC
MERYSKKVLSVRCLTILLCLGGALGCSETRAKKEHQPKEYPREVIEDFSACETRIGKPVWRLRAKNAEVYEDRTDVYQLKFQLYDEGKAAGLVSAEKGKISPGSGNVHLNGNVVAVNSQYDVRLETQSLLWDNEKRKILSDDFVQQTRGNMQMTGWGLEADARLEKVTLKRDIKILQLQ